METLHTVHIPYPQSIVQLSFDPAQQSYHNKRLTLTNGQLKLLLLLSESRGSVFFRFYTHFWREKNI